MDNIDGFRENTFCINPGTPRLPGHAHERCLITENNDYKACFGHYIEVDLTKPSEVPVALLGVARKMLFDEIPKSVVFISTTHREKKNTSTAIFKAFNSVTFFNMGESNALRCIATNKEDVYYGCRNLILDSDFNPIYMPVVTVHPELFSKGRPLIDCLKDPKIRISSKVFEQKDKLIHKVITKRLLIECSGATFEMGDLYGFKVNVKPEVVISDYNPFKTPVKPSVNSADTETFRKILIENFNNIVA